MNQPPSSRPPLPAFLEHYRSLFSDKVFRLIEKDAPSVRALFRDLAARSRPSIRSLLPHVAAVQARLKGDPGLERWFEVMLDEKDLNAFGSSLGKPLPPFFDRFMNLLYLGRILSPGIETQMERALPPRVLEDRTEPWASLVVLAWNGWEETRECLASLLHFDPGISHEILVVDNASTDETREEMPRMAAVVPHLRHVRSETNLGFSGGNNLGAREARGKYLLFLNNDIVIQDPRWLRRLVETMESDPRVGSTGQFGVADCEGEAEDCAFFQVVFFPGLMVPVAWISGYCLMVRRDAFDAVGGWRGDLYGMAGHEDIHMGYALRAKGWTSVVPPRWIPLFHKIRRTRKRPDAAAVVAAESLSSAVKEERFRACFGSRRRRANYALDDAVASDIDARALENPHAGIDPPG